MIMGTGRFTVTVIRLFHLGYEYHRRQRLKYYITFAAALSLPWYTPPFSVRRKDDDPADRCFMAVNASAGPIAFPLPITQPLSERSGAGPHPYGPRTRG